MTCLNSTKVAMEVKKTTWRHHHFTYMYHKWQSYDVWFLRYGAWQTQFFDILDHFLPIYPPNNPKKSKFLKNKKKHMEISSFYIYVCQKLWSNDVWFLRYGEWWMDRQKDKWPDGWTDGLTEKVTYRAGCVT